MMLENLPTKEEAVLVIKVLKKVNIKIPSGLHILAKLKEINEQLSKGASTKEVINMFGLKCKPVSFPTIYKRTIGVSITDIPKMTKQDKIKSGLDSLNLTPKQYEDLVKLISSI